MDVKELIEVALGFGVAVFSIVLWAYAIVMLISGTLTFIFLKGKDRFFGLIMVVMGLIVLPMLIADYPTMLAQAALDSYRNTLPVMQELGAEIENTVGGALPSSAPAEPPAPSAEPPQAGGGAPAELPAETAVPTAAPTSPPTLAPNEATPDFKATAYAVETPAPTAPPTATVAPFVTPRPDDPAWPTPIIMTPKGG